MEKKKKEKQRDKSVLDETAASLSKLAEAGALEITDRTIINHNLDMILKLRAKRIPHAAIYQTLCKSGGLTISEKTYRQYVGEAKKERGLTRKPAPKPTAQGDDNPA